jgi:hypothetical protein
LGFYFGVRHGKNAPREFDKVEIACINLGGWLRQIRHSESVEDALAADLKSVAEINCIFVERVEGNLLVWMTADHPPKEARERIFQKQFDLIDAFPEVSFDFNIVSTSANDPREIDSAAKLIYFR